MKSNGWRGEDLGEAIHAWYEEYQGHKERTR